MEALNLFIKRKPVLRIRIIKFLSLADPDPLVRGTDPDPLVRGTDPDSDPSIIKQKWQEKPLCLLFCDFYVTFYLRRMM